MNPKPSNSGSRPSNPPPARSKITPKSPRSSSRVKKLTKRPSSARPPWIRTKQTDQAIEILKGLLDKDKNRARVYQKELLEIYLAVDLKDEAIAAAEQVVSLAPSDPEARLTLAQVYQMYRQPEKAFGEYRYAL